MEENDLKIQGLVRVRWIALGFQILAIYPAVQLGYLKLAQIPLYGMTVGLLLLLNLCSKGALTRSVHPTQVLLQLCADMIGLTSLLFLTGGAWNPFSMLLFFHVGLGALLLERSLNQIFFIGVILCFGFLGTVPLSEPLARKPVPMQILVPCQLVTAFIIWNLIGRFSEMLRSLRKNVDRLKEQKQRMDHLKAVGALSAGFSHEFATPLNTVRMRLERLQRALGSHPDVEVALGALDQCESTLRSMAQSRLEPETFTLKTMDLRALIPQLCESWKSIHPDADLQLLFPPSADKAECELPPVSFAQAFLNILDNAYDSYEAEVKASAAPCIEVSCKSSEKQISLQISDRGGGLSPWVQKNWGEPFITTKKEGTGLGLYNALNLMQVLGGEFSLENRNGGGVIARFLFEPSGGGQES